MRRVLWVVACVLVVSMLPASAAFAADAEPTTEKNSLVVLTGDVTVSALQSVDSVVVFDGNAYVDGTVSGAVVVFSGNATISGEVAHDVAVFDGVLTLLDGAHVHGSVYADRHVIAPGAKVDGSVQGTAKFAVAAGWGGFAVWIGTVIAISLSLLVLGLLFLWFAPRAADAAIATGRTAVGASAGWGALLFFGLPIVASLALVTVVGLPIGLAVLFALGLIYGIGTVAGSLFLGRLMVKTGSRAAAFALGWLIVTLTLLVPGVGWLVWLVVTGYGLGILCVAAYRAKRAPSEPAPEAPMPAAPMSV